tara:strand:+ start:1857 stop:2357 length:501 start_codon:yes stop_codon:yes gene_type:complete
MATHENLQNITENSIPKIDGEDLKKKGASVAVMGTIGIIASLLKNAFKPPKKLKPIPPGLISTGVDIGSHNGLSKIDTAAKIIERKKSIGIPIGPLPSGAKNISNQADVIAVEEILENFLVGAQIVVEVPIGGMNVLSTGVLNGPSGTVTSNGTNTIPVQIKGIIR